MDELLSSLHPAAVHFPIALLLAAALFEGLGLLLGERGRPLRAAATACLALGAAGAVASAALFHPDPEFPRGTAVGDLLFRHEVLAWATTALALLLALVRLFLLWKGKADGKARWPFLAGLLLVAALAGATGYFGGELVFRHGVAVHALGA